MSEDNPLVYIVDGNQHYIRMYLHAGWGLAHSPMDADLIQFTGGEDVTPELYGEIVHPTTQYNPIRDKRESIIFENCKGKIPLVGICRGGQFLNVMCGGKMWQDCDNHALHGVHEVLDHFTGQVYSATSTHHQMMRPSDDAIIIATAQESSYVAHMDGHIQHCKNHKVGAHLDTEVCFYPEQNALCFQPHPEYLGSPEMTKKFFEYIAEYSMNPEKWRTECAA